MKVKCNIKIVNSYILYDNILNFFYASFETTYFIQKLSTIYVAHYFTHTQWYKHSLKIEVEWGNY